MNKIHTKRDAESLIFLLQKLGYINAKLIGSFGNGKETSEHDIDVYIPKLPGFLSKRFKSKQFADTMKNLLDAESYEYTDMESWYFTNTFFGDVDMFHNIDHFDY
jgi:predicted nucleotidyltransferase